MQNQDPLLQIKLEKVKNFIENHKFGKVEEIKYRKNTIGKSQPFVAEDNSLEIRFVTKSGNNRGIVFSSHGVANIIDGKKYLLPTDSEERFNSENSEFHKLSYEWTTMLARELGSTQQTESEIKYRKSIHEKLDRKRSEAAAIRGYYKNTCATLEDQGKTNTAIYIQNKENLEYYTNLAETLSACKQLQTKCIKGLSQILEDIKSWE